MKNIAELLKNCPQGTKLYSPIFGEVELEKVCYTSIIVKGKSGVMADFYVDGRYHSTGECMLFPSKENRDWSTFQRPFKDGDVVYVQASCEYIAIYKDLSNEYLYDYVSISGNRFQCAPNPLTHRDYIRKMRFATLEEQEKLFDAIKANGYNWNSKTKTLEKLIEPKFKVGDRVKKNKDYISGTVTDIFDDSFKVTYDDGGCSYVQFHYQCDWELVTNHKFKVGDVIMHKTPNTKYRVTDFVGGCMYVLKRCKDNYIYQMYIKYVDDEFELVPNKFDISTLEPFDKVLVRNNSLENWHIQFFENYNTQTDDVRYPFVCLWNIKYSQCIPYEGNKHLRGTANACDEYYKTW